MRLSGGTISPYQNIAGDGINGPTLVCVEKLIHDFRGTSIVLFTTEAAMESAQYVTGWAGRSSNSLEISFSGGLIKTNEPSTGPRYYERFNLTEGRSRAEFLAATKNIVRAASALQKAVRSLGLKI